MTKHYFPYAPWTPEEDAKLLGFKEQGLPWKEITALIPGRTAAAAQTRWEWKFKGKRGKHQARNERRKVLRDIRCREERFADGAPIFEGSYVFRVPDGDPYLQKLIKVHGADNINREVVLRKVA